MKPKWARVCLHFSPETSQRAVDFVVKETLVSRARLEVKQVDSDHLVDPGLTLIVGADDERILEVAEELRIKVRDKKGVLRQFDADQVEAFPNSGCVGPLTFAQTQRCVLHAMEALHFEADVNCLPGHEDCRLLKGASITASYRDAGLLEVFALHEPESLDSILGQWMDIKHTLKPPIEAVRDYFGEGVGLYFSFICFYTAFLLPVGVLGVLQFIMGSLLHLGSWSTVLFVALKLLSVSFFLELWKRRSNSHAFKWGTSGKLRHKHARPEFRGQWRRSPTTNMMELYYPRYKTLRKLLCVSLPITMLFLILGFIFMLASFEADRWVLSLFTDVESGEIWSNPVVSVISLVPSLLYSLVIVAMNRKYVSVANYLTEWENHRTQEQFEGHVVFKLVVFEFVNTFSALFYIAFYLQDQGILNNQIFTMLITQAAINHIQESLLPTLLQKRSVHMAIASRSKQRLQRIAKPNHNPPDILEKASADDPAVLFTKAYIEKNYQPLSICTTVLCVVESMGLDSYLSTYDDFLELWLQFGHVFLFASVFPLAPMLAMISNLIEIRADAHKLCRLTRKPVPRSVRDIGAWYSAFDLLSVTAIMTNCALLAMDQKLRSSAPDGTSQVMWVLLFVVIEHLFLLSRHVIDLMISDVTKEVKDAQDRNDFSIKKQL